MFIFDYSTIVDPFMRDIRLFAPKFAGIKKGDKTLDVCCGTGDQAFYYAAQGAIATGIDMDSDMIRAAKKDKRNKKLINVSFQIADAENLPFEDNLFDYASISFGLHENERNERNKIISEMKRVVKEKGSLLFIDFQVPLPNNFYSYFIRFIECLAGKTNFKCFKDYIKQGGLDEILRDNQLSEEKRATFKNANVVMIKTKNI